MRRLISLLLFLSMSGLMTLQRTQVGISAAPDYDVIIRNGRVIDGSGRAGFNADIAIKDDHIARIGNLRGAKAKREIDARGQIVAPGFIDMLGQSEQYVLIDRRAMSKVMMGVTTEITGESESIAPINDRILKEQEDFNRRFNQGGNQCPIPPRRSRFQCQRRPILPAVHHPKALKAQSHIRAA